MVTEFLVQFEPGFQRQLEIARGRIASGIPDADSIWDDLDRSDSDTSG